MTFPNPRGNPPRRQQPRRARHPVLVLVLLFAAALAVCGGIVFAGFYLRDRDQEQYRLSE